MNILERRQKEILASQRKTLMMLQYCDQKIDYTNPQAFRTDPDGDAAVFYKAAFNAVAQSSLTESEVKTWLERLALELDDFNELKSPSLKIFELNNLSMAKLIKAVKNSGNELILSKLAPISDAMKKYGDKHVADSSEGDYDAMFPADSIERATELAKVELGRTLGQIRLLCADLARDCDFVSELVQVFNKSQLDKLEDRKLSEFECEYNEADPQETRSRYSDASITPFQYLIKEKPSLEGATLGQLTTDTEFWAGFAKRAMKDCKLIDDTSLEMNAAWQLLVGELQSVVSDIFVSKETQDKLQAPRVKTANDGRQFEQLSYRDVFNQILSDKSVEISERVKPYFRNFYAFLSTQPQYLTGQILAQYLAMGNQALANSHNQKMASQLAAVLCSPIATALKLAGNIVNNRTQSDFANLQSTSLDFVVNNWFCHYLITAEEFNNPAYFEPGYTGLVHHPNQKLMDAYHDELRKRLDKMLSTMWQQEGCHIPLEEPTPTSPPVSPRALRKTKKQKSSVEDMEEMGKQLEGLQMDDEETKPKRHRGIFPSRKARKSKPSEPADSTPEERAQLLRRTLSWH